MSTIKLTFGTKDFLETKLAPASILAHHAQNRQYFLLIQPLTHAEPNAWQSIPTNKKLPQLTTFFRATLQLNAENTALLINKADCLDEDSVLYKKIDQSQLMIMTVNHNILAEISQLLNVSLGSLNASLIKYVRA